MQSHQHRRLAWLSVILAFGVVVAACGGSDDNASSSSSGSGDGSSGSCSGDITGSGASFPDAFYQEAITKFADSQPDLTVSYNAVGSGSGKQEFGENLNDFAGSDSLVKDGDGPKAGSFLYVPTTASAVTVSYNLPGVDKLQLSADTVAGLFQGTIKTWDDPAVKADNPDADLPGTKVIIAHRSDGSGTTNNFTKYLDAASDKWELGSGDTVKWPGDSQAGPQNTGVAQLVKSNEGGVGYVDLSDATESGLTWAAIKNADGDYVEPTVDTIQAALAGVKPTADLTIDPLDAPGADSYPITAPTYILVRTSYDNADTASAVKCFVDYLVSDTASIGKDLGFASLPDSLKQQAVAQLDKINS